MRQLSAEKADESRISGRLRKSNGSEFGGIKRRKVEHLYSALRSGMYETSLSESIEIFGLPSVGKWVFIGIYR
jgi:hypothetical protein